MLNSISNLKKITFLIHFLIFSSSIFLIWQMLSRADLPIKEIMIKGQYDSIDSEQIHLIANKYLIGNLFTINLKSTQNAFKKLPWIRDVSIRRDWNNFGLLVEIESHKPIARWNNRGLVNSFGEIFHAAYEDDLPLFVGPDEFVKEMTVKFNQINSTKKFCNLLKIEQKYLVKLSHIETYLIKGNYLYFLNKGVKILTFKKQ